MIEAMLFPFQFGFMVNAFWIALILSVPTALLSCFLVLKGWALMGDAVSHAVLPGIVLAFILGLPLILGAFAAGMFTAVATGYLADNSRVKPESTPTCTSITSFTVTCSASGRRTYGQPVWSR
jgi:manganese/iron transport system permease protein